MPGGGTTPVLGIVFHTPSCQNSERRVGQSQFYTESESSPESIRSANELKNRPFVTLFGS